MTDELRSHRLDAGVVHGGRGAGCGHGLVEERGLLADALDEVDMGAGHVSQRAGDHQPRETGAGAEVRPAARLRREGEKLERVGDVTRPHLRDGGRGDEVHPLLAFAEQGDEAGEAVGCFT